jgi:PIN domain nuclease of toxin-antitoxin system
VSYLFDTHVLVWAANDNPRLPDEIKTIIDNMAMRRSFSAAVLWEIVIKGGRERGMPADPEDFRKKLVRVGFTGLPITSAHVLAVRNLPPIHRDPFDRIMVAQAIVEGLTLVTADTKLARYPARLLVV